MRYHVIYSVFCMMLYVARGSGQLFGEVVDTLKSRNYPVVSSGEYTRKIVNLMKAEISPNPVWKMSSSRSLLSISSSSLDEGGKKRARHLGEKSFRRLPPDKVVRRETHDVRNNISVPTNASSLNNSSESADNSTTRKNQRRSVENFVEDNYHDKESKRSLENEERVRNIGGKLAQPVWQVRESPRQSIASPLSSVNRKFPLESLKKSEDRREEKISQRRQPEGPKFNEENVPMPRGYSESKKNTYEKSTEDNDLKRNIVGRQLKDNESTGNIGRQPENNDSKRNIFGRNFPGPNTAKGPYILDTYAPGQTLHLRGKFKRGFQFVPLSRNLYVLEENSQNPQERSLLDDRSSPFVGVPRQSGPLFVNEDDNFETKNSDRTSAVLSFKAHMHHDVKDIGNNFRRNIPDNGLRLVNTNVDSQGSWNFPDVSLDSSNFGPVQYPSVGYLQENSASNVQASNYPQFVDPSPINPSVLDDIRMYGGNNLLYNPNPRLIAAPQSFLASSSSQDRNPGAQYSVDNFHDNRLPYDNWRVPDSRISMYRETDRAAPVYQSPLAFEQNSWINSPEYAAPRGSLDDLERGVRQNPEVASAYRLGYLDRYAKALSSANENYANDLEAISSQLRDPEDEARESREEGEISESSGVDDSPVQSRESLDDIEKDLSGQNENVVNPRDISSLDNDQVEAPTASSKLLSNWETNVYEYPNPSYIPQRILNSQPREDDTPDASSISSSIQENNATTHDPPQVGVKGKSFSNVIEPLTAQLQTLLSTIKLVNENLTREENGGHRADGETRRKRLVSSSEKTRRKRDHEAPADDSVQAEDVDTKENYREVEKRPERGEERSDEISQDQQMQEAGTAMEKNNSLALNASDANTKAPVTSTESQNSKNMSVTKMKNYESRGITKRKRNHGIMDFFEKTFGFATKYDQSTLKTTVYLFESTSLESSNAETAGTVSQETTEEEYSSSIEVSTGTFESFTENFETTTTTRRDITENPGQGTEIDRMTTISGHKGEENFVTSITMINTHRTDDPNIVETEKMDQGPSDRDNGHEGAGTTSLPITKIEESTTRETNFSGKKNDSFSLSEFRAKTGKNTTDLSTYRYPSSILRNSSSTLGHETSVSSHPKLGPILPETRNETGHKRKESLIGMSNKIDDVPSESMNEPSRESLTTVSSKIDDVSVESMNESSSRSPTFTRVTTSLEKPKQTDRHDGPAETSADQSSARSLGSLGVLLEPSDKMGEQRLSINDSELKRARESGAQEFLVKLLAPGVIKRITSEGVVVRLPDGSSEFPSSQIQSSNVQRLVEPKRAETRYREINKTATATSRSHVYSMGFQTARKSKTQESKSRESNDRDEGNVSQFFAPRNNSRSVRPVNAKSRLMATARTDSRSRTNEQDAVVAVSGDDTGGNARVDIRLKIPIHKSRNRRKFVSRNSKEQKFVGSKKSDSPKRETGDKSLMKRSAYEDYEELEDYDDYLGDYDLDSSEYYALESPDSPDAEEIYANAYLEALEPEASYEDDDETSDDEAYEYPLKNDSEAPEQNSGAKGNVKASKSHVWPEHVGQESLSKLDEIESRGDSSTPLYQPPKNPQINRSDQKNRTNDNKGRIESKRKNITMTKASSSYDKSGGEKTSNFERPGYVRLGRKLQSLTEFTCNRKLLSLSDTDDDLVEEILEEPIGEFTKDSFEMLTTESFNPQKDPPTKWDYERLRDKLQDAKWHGDTESISEFETETTVEIERTSEVTTEMSAATESRLTIEFETETTVETESTSEVTTETSVATESRLTTKIGGNDSKEEKIEETSSTKEITTFNSTVVTTESETTVSETSESDATGKKEEMKSTAQTASDKVTEDSKTLSTVTEESGTTELNETTLTTTSKSRLTTKSGGNDSKEKKIEETLGTEEITTFNSTVVTTESETTVSETSESDATGKKEEMKSTAQTASDKVTEDSKTLSTVTEESGTTELNETTLTTTSKSRLTTESGGNDSKEEKIKETSSTEEITAFNSTVVATESETTVSETSESDATGKKEEMKSTAQTASDKVTEDSKTLSTVTEESGTTELNETTLTTTSTMLPTVTTQRIETLKSTIPIVTTMPTTTSISGITLTTPSVITTKLGKTAVSITQPKETTGTSLVETVTAPKTTETVAGELFFNASTTTGSSNFTNKTESTTVLTSRETEETLIVTTLPVTFTSDFLTTLAITSPGSVETTTEMATTNTTESLETSGESTSTKKLGEVTEITESTKFVTVSSTPELTTENITTSETTLQPSTTITYPTIGTSETEVYKTESTEMIRSTTVTEETTLLTKVVAPTSVAATSTSVVTNTKTMITETSVPSTTELESTTNNSSTTQLFTTLGKATMRVSTTTESMTTESMTTESMMTESTTRKPMTTEPMMTESTTTESMTTKSMTTESMTTESMMTESTTPESTTTEAMTTESMTTGSMMTESTTTESMTTESTTTESMMTESMTTESMMTESTTPESTTTESMTTESMMTEYTTPESTTTESMTTESMTTESMMTESATTKSTMPESTTTQSTTTKSSMKQSTTMGSTITATEPLTTKPASIIKATKIKTAEEHSATPMISEIEETTTPFVRETTVTEQSTTTEETKEITTPLLFGTTLSVKSPETTTIAVTSTSTTEYSNVRAIFTEETSIITAAATSTTESQTATEKIPTVGVVETTPGSGFGEELEMVTASQPPEEIETTIKFEGTTLSDEFVEPKAEKKEDIKDIVDDNEETTSITEVTSSQYTTKTVELAITNKPIVTAEPMTEATSKWPETTSRESISTASELSQVSVSSTIASQSTSIKAESTSLKEDKDTTTQPEIVVEITEETTSSRVNTTTSFSANTSRTEETTVIATLIDDDKDYHETSTAHEDEESSKSTGTEITSTRADFTTSVASASEETETPSSTSTYTNGTLLTTVFTIFSTTVSQLQSVFSTTMMSISSSTEEIETATSVPESKLTEKFTTGSELAEEFTAGSKLTAKSTSEPLEFTGTFDVTQKTTSPLFEETTVLTVQEMEKTTETKTATSSTVPAITQETTAILSTPLSKEDEEEYETETEMDPGSKDEYEESEETDYDDDNEEEIDKSSTLGWVDYDENSTEASETTVTDETESKYTKTTKPPDETKITREGAETIISTLPKTSFESSVLTEMTIFPTSFTGLGTTEEATELPEGSSPVTFLTGTTTLREEEKEVSTRRTTEMRTRLTEEYFIQTSPLPELVEETTRHEQEFPKVKTTTELDITLPKFLERPEEKPLSGSEETTVSETSEIETSDISKVTTERLEEIVNSTEETDLNTTGSASSQEFTTGSESTKESTISTTSEIETSDISKVTTERLEEIVSSTEETDLNTTGSESSQEFTTGSESTKESTISTTSGIETSDISKVTTGRLEEMVNSTEETDLNTTGSESSQEFTTGSKSTNELKDSFSITQEATYPSIEETSVITVEEITRITESTTATIDVEIETTTNVPEKQKAEGEEEEGSKTDTESTVETDEKESVELKNVTSKFDDEEVTKEPSTKDLLKLDEDMTKGLETTVTGETTTGFTKDTSGETKIAEILDITTRGLDETLGFSGNTDVLSTGSTIAGEIIDTFGLTTTTGVAEEITGLGKLPDIITGLDESFLTSTVLFPESSKRITEFGETVSTELQFFPTLTFESPVTPIGLTTGVIEPEESLSTTILKEEMTKDSGGDEKAEKYDNKKEEYDKKEEESSSTGEAEDEGRKSDSVKKTNINNESDEEISSTRDPLRKKTFEALKAKEKDLLEKEKQQQARQKKLKNRMKELKKKEKELIERELALEKKLKRLRKEKARREKERVEEEKRRTTTTEEPTTTIENIEVKELEETSRKQDELEDELEKLEKQIKDKEIELEKREKELEKKEKALAAELGKLEKGRARKTSLTPTVVSTKLTNTRRTTIKPLVEPSERTPVPPIETTTPASKIPPSTTTIPTVEEETKRTATTESEERSDKVPIGEGTEEPEDEKTDGYVCDKDEEVWREKQPEGYDKVTDDTVYEEGCDPSAKVTTESVNDVPEEATKKVCLHVLQSDSLLTDSKKKSKDFVTEIVCLPYNPEERNDNNRRRRRRVVRKLMDHDDDSPTLRPVESLKNTTESDETIVLDKRHEDEIVKKKKINFLNLLHHEWQHGGTTPALHTPIGFTRLYENWFEVPRVREASLEEDGKEISRNPDHANEPIELERRDNIGWTEGSTIVPTTEDFGSPSSDEGEGIGRDDKEDISEDENTESIDFKTNGSDRERRSDKMAGKSGEKRDIVISNEDIPPGYQENCQLQLYGNDETETRSDANKDLTPVPPVETDAKKLDKGMFMDTDDEDMEDDNNEDDDEEMEDDENVDNAGKGMEDEGNVDHDDKGMEDEENVDHDDKGMKNYKNLDNDDKGMKDYKNVDNDDKEMKDYKSVDNDDEEMESDKNVDNADKGMEDDEYVDDDEEKGDDVFVDYVEETEDHENEDAKEGNDDDESVSLKSLKKETKVKGDPSHEEENETPTGDGGDHGDEKNVEDDPAKSKAIKKTGRANKKVAEKEKLLSRMEKELLKEQASLKKKEDDIKRAEKKLMMSEKASKLLKSMSHSARIVGRKILESDEEMAESWPTETSDRYHVGGEKDWITAEPDEEYDGSLRKSKQAFTVNVLRLEYDEEEENNKMKCVQPSPEEMIVRTGLVKGPRDNNDEAINEHPDDDSAILGNSEDSEVQYEDTDESNDEIGYAEETVPIKQMGKVMVAPSFRDRKKKCKTRNPPGSEWPTERTTRYHVGGTLTWSKELAGNPKDDSRKVREAKVIEDDSYDDDDAEASYEIDENGNEREKRSRVRGTTCYTVIVKSGKSKFRKSVNDYPRRMKKSEQQIERPGVVRIHRGHRWRSIDNEARKRSRIKKPLMILKRDVLGRKLSGFEQTRENSGSSKSSDDFLASKKPKLRTIKSIEGSKVGENFESNEEDHGDEEIDDYEDDEEINEYQDDEEENDDDDDDRQAIREVSSDENYDLPEDTIHFPSENDSTTRMYDHTDVFLAPTGKVVAKKRQETTDIGKTNSSGEFSTTRVVQQWGIGEAKSVTKFPFPNVTTDELILPQFTAVKIAQEKNVIFPENFATSSDETRYKAVTENHEVDNNDGTKVLFTSEQVREYTRPRSEENTENVTFSRTREETTVTIPAAFQTHQLTTVKTPKSSDASKHRFFGEYADYGQDSKFKKKISKVSSLDEIDPSRIRKGMDDTLTDDETTENLENEKRLFEVKSITRHFSQEPGQKIAWFEKDLTLKKAFPILVKLDDAKLLELKKLREPPKEIYVLYKCGPPAVITEYESTDSGEKKKLTTPTEEAKTSYRTTTRGMENFTTRLDENLTTLKLQGISINRETSTDKPYSMYETNEKNNNYKIFNSEAEETSYSSEDADFVPLCGGFVESEFARSLTVNTGKTTTRETSELFGITVESTIPVTTNIETSLAGNTENSLPTDSPDSKESSKKHLNGQEAAVGASNETEEITTKTHERETKILDFSNARKRQSPLKKFISGKDKKSIANESSKKNGRNEGKKRKSLSSRGSRSSRSLNSRSNNSSFETWDAEVNLEGKETTKMKSQRGEVRRNVISSYDNTEIDDDASHDYSSDYEDPQNADKTGRSLLGLDKSSKNDEKRSRTGETKKKSSIKIRASNKINTSDVKSSDPGRSKSRILRDLGKKFWAEDKRVDFRKSPALDTGVIDEDDNTTETSSLLDKVMEMINPKSNSEKIDTEDALKRKDITEITKEEKPRSLFDKVKYMLGSAIGLRPKNNTEITTEIITDSKIITSRPKLPNYLETNILPQDTETILSSLKNLKNNKTPTRQPNHSKKPPPHSSTKFSQHGGKKKLTFEKNSKKMAAPKKHTPDRPGKMKNSHRPENDAKKKSKHDKTKNKSSTSKSKISNSNKKKPSKISHKPSSKSKKKSSKSKHPFLKNKTIAGSSLKSATPFIPYEFPTKDSKNNKRHGKLVFKNEAKSLNANDIIPRVRDLVEKQNLGSVEKIIVYVDKNEHNRNRHSIASTARNFPRHSVDKKRSKMGVHTHEKRKKSRRTLVSQKLDEPVEKRYLNFQGIDKVSETNFPDQLKSGKLSFNGVSLDEIVSRVADEILKSAVNSRDYSQTLDPRISVKVIQEVANGTELPHEETKKKFLLDMSGQPIPHSSSHKKKIIHNHVHREILKNSGKSPRLTSKTSKRRMNLPDVPRKNRRRNWKKKIRREERESKKRNLDIIRRRLLRELTRKLRKQRIQRALRRKADKKIGSKVARRNHDIRKIDEKIRIIYGMRHKKEDDENLSDNGERNVLEDTMRRKKNHWKSILPLRRAIKRNKKFSKKHARKNRPKRDADFASSDEYYATEDEKNVENLYESIKKIVGRNIDLPKDSIVSENPNEILQGRNTVDESQKNVTSNFRQARENNTRIINSRDITDGPDDRDSSKKSRRNVIQPRLDIANARNISYDDNITSNDTVFYKHMLDLQNKLLKKSDLRSSRSTYLIRGRNAELAEKVCPPKNCENLCQTKYERVKHLMHAGAHYLLRRFDDCENCKSDVSCPENDMISSRLVENKREDRSTTDVENMAEKILHFASTIDSRRDASMKNRRVDEREVENLVEKFGIDELGLTSEKDKKSLAALVNEIVNVQKNVNETLEIIRTRLGKKEKKTKNKAKKLRRKSNAEKNSGKKKATKDKKKGGKNDRKKIKYKEAKTKANKKSQVKKTKEKTKPKEKTKKVKKNVPAYEIDKKNSTLTSKKKLDDKSSPANHLDEIGEDIRKILTEENKSRSRAPMPESEQNLSNSSRKTREVIDKNNEFFPRYARDIEDTNVAKFGKYRVRRVRSSAWNRADLPSVGSEEMIFNDLPNFLDFTNVNFDRTKKKSNVNERSFENTTIASANISTKKGSSSSSSPRSSSVGVTTKGVPSSKPARGNGSRKTEKNRKVSEAPSKKQKPKKKSKHSKHEKHHHPRKKGGKNIPKVVSDSKNKKKHPSGHKKPPELVKSQGDQVLRLKLTGRVNFIEDGPQDKEDKLKIPASHLSVRRKLQSSPQMATPRKSDEKILAKWSRNKESTRGKKLKKRSVSKNSNSAVKTREISTRQSKRRESQTIIPIENGRMRVKYIYRDATELPRDHTPKVKHQIREVTTDEIKYFREKQKAVFTSDVPDGERSFRKTNCPSCICDLVETIEELKKILSLRGDTWMRIVDYECTKYEDVGNDIVLVSTGIIGDVLPKSRRDLAEAKGMKYVKPEDIEDVLKDESRDGKINNEFMSFPGNDLNVPCNHDSEDITWLTSISKPNYTWTRDDGLPVSGLIRKNGNLELYDVDAKDSGNYTCFVSYIDPDNEELVQNLYGHRIEVVTLPRYTLRGGNRYRLENCDETVLDVLASHLPKKLNDILCKGSVCDAFIYAPRCYHKQISIRTLIMPSSTVKLFPIGASQCGIQCRKAVQDKVALMLSKNLRNVLQKSIVFRLPHRSQDRLVPIVDKPNVSRNKRGRKYGKKGGDVDGEVGLLVGCPAGYGLRDSHCLPCSPGSYSDNLGSRCKRCPAGTHQPNTGARTCRACTNPFVEGCYEMFWNSSSAVMAILASLCAVVTIFMILVWMLCCGKGRKANSELSCARSTGLELKYQQGIVDRSMRQPLIEQSRDLTDDDERWCDCEKVRKKKKRFLRRKMLSRDEDGQEILAHRSTERRQRIARDRSDQKAERVRTVPISCIDSYRSHGGGHCRSNSPKRYDYGKPPLPLPDFPR